jgi:fructokinase
MHWQNSTRIGKRSPCSSQRSCFLGFTVASYGEALWDLLPTGPVLGGAPLNFAYRVNSLGNRGVIISRLGRDDLGQKALEQITTLGMEERFLQWDDEHPTGTVEVHLDEDRNPDYTIIEGVAYDYIETLDGLLDLIKRADCLCFGTLIQRTEISRRTLWQLLDGFSGAFTLLDINLRKKCYSEKTIASSLDRANILKLNEEELNALVGVCRLSGTSLPGFVESLVKKANLRYCVVTLGPKGAFAISDDGEAIYSPGFEVDLIDPCGAGDGFSAGFIHFLLNKRPLTEACQFGNALGALVAQQEGATQPITYEEIRDFMGKGTLSQFDARLEDFLV